MKTIKKVVVLLISILLLTVIFSTISQAATALLTASSYNVEVGTKVTIRASGTAAAWSVYIDGDGITRTPVVGDDPNAKNTSFSGSTSFTPTKAGTYKITLTGTISDENDTGEGTAVNKSVTITVKAKSSGGSGSGSSSGSSSGSTTEKPKDPTFKSANKTVYTTGTVNLRSSWSTSSSATQVPAGTELKLTGTSTEKVNGYTWYRVTYKGSTKYVSSTLVTSTKPAEEKPEEKSSNKALSSLSIEGVELTPKFDKETTQYTVKVEEDVKELKINAKAADSKAKVSIEGNKDLKEGDNVIKIKVTAEDSTTRTYFITATKGETAGTTTDTKLQLSTLSISRVELDFKPETYSYEFSLSSYVKNLDITATPNQEDAKVEITGNEELKAGKNVITILVSSANGEETANYQLEVTVPEEVVEKKANEPSMYLYIAIGVVASVVIIGIFVVISRRRNADEDYDDEDEYDEENDYEREEEEEVKSRVRPRKSEEVTLDDFLNTPEEEEKPRKARGKHSV